MTKAEEAALKAYPIQDMYSSLLDGSNELKRDVFIEGYQKAEKDLIAQIRELVEQWMPPDNPEESVYFVGERVAYRSVLRLLEELEEKK